VILRAWRGRADSGREDAYPQHFHDEVVPALQRVPGFLGARLVRRATGDSIEFLVLTQWRSLAAIQAFAGADAETAVVEPGAAAALVDFDRTVLHYEIVEDVPPANPAPCP
jgi:heme-degrading monooxygenase HmoA